MWTLRRARRRPALPYLVALALLVPAVTVSAAAAAARPRPVLAHGSGGGVKPGPPRSGRVRSARSPARSAATRPADTAEKKRGSVPLSHPCLKCALPANAATGISLSTATPASAATNAPSAQAAPKR